MGTEPPLPCPSVLPAHTRLCGLCVHSKTQRQNSPAHRLALSSLLSLQADRQVKPCATCKRPLALWGVLRRASGALWSWA